jgi:DNA-binding MarR family transcriptional regulator
MKLVAEALDSFIAAGLVERLHNPTDAARLYLLAVHHPEDKGLKTLLELATTRQGRHQILEALNPNRSRPEGQARRLRLMKSASA